MKTIGILGGMGPQATVMLQSRIIDAVRAEDDADHVPLIVDMNPQVPSRLDWILGEGRVDPAPVLAAMARRLEAAGAEALAMPCNTAHYFADAIRGAVGIPFLDMVDLSCKAAVALAGGKVGILASPATDRIGLFREALGRHGGEAIWPGDQAAMLAAIRRIKAEGPGERDAEALRVAAETCAGQGAGCLMIGCTEFSLLKGALEGQGLPVLDTLDVLVGEIVAFSGAAAR